MLNALIWTVESCSFFSLFYVILSCSDSQRGCVGQTLCLFMCMTARDVKKKKKKSSSSKLFYSFVYILWF